MHIKSRLYTWNVYFCTDITKLYALATPPIHLKWITSSVIVCSELAWNIIHMQHQLKCHLVAYCMHFSASNECKMIFQKKTEKRQIGTKMYRSFRKNYTEFINYFNRAWKVIKNKTFVLFLKMAFQMHRSSHPNDNYVW